MIISPLSEEDFFALLYSIIQNIDLLKINMVDLQKLYQNFDQFLLKNQCNHFF